MGALFLLIIKIIESSWAQYTLILKNSEERSFVQTELKNKNIPTMIYYPIPMHRQTAFKNYNFNLKELKTSEYLAERVLSIPMHTYIEEVTLNTIVDALLNCK